MVESRWGRRIGPAVAVLGALTLVTTTTVGARDRSWDPPPCAAIPRSSAAPPGTWWRLDPRLEGGRLTGQRLALGGPGGHARWMALPAEAFAAGPFAGQVLIGTDDGRRSRLSLVDPARGCSGWIADATDVVRTATLTPDRTAVLEMRVDRRTRADLGVYRRPLDGGAPVRILAPIKRDAQFGPTWSTRLVWSLDGRTLAVESCGAIACRVRVVDPATGRVRLVAAPDQGELVGLAAGHLIVREACGGMPCAVVAAVIATGERVTLDHEAWRVALAIGAAGRARVVLETGRDGRTLMAMDPDGRRPTRLRPDPSGRRLVPGAAAGESAIEVAPGAVVLAPDGRLSDTGTGAVGLRRLADDTTIDLREVTR